MVLTAFTGVSGCHTELWDSFPVADPNSSFTHKLPTLHNFGFSGHTSRIVALDNLELRMEPVGDTQKVHLSVVYIIIQQRF